MRVIIALLVALVPFVSVAGGPVDNASYFVGRGKVTIVTPDAHQLFVELDDITAAAPDGDGVVDHLFRFWSDAPLTGFAIGEDEASVEFRGDELVVMTGKSNRFVVLQVEGRHPAVPVGPVGFTAYAAQGYGLTHATGLKTEPGKRPWRAIANPIYHPDPIEEGGGSSGSCDSGGIGSTSCSTSCGSMMSCSVSCGNGYYACCKKCSLVADPDCKCVKL